MHEPGRRVTILLLAAILVVTALEAQDRNSFFFGIGAGYGSNWSSCSEGPDPSTCGSTTQSNGFAGFFKIGGYLSESIGLGFETNGWYGEVGNTDLWQSNFSGVVYFYPGGGSFMLRGGLGLASAEFRFPSGFTTFVTTETGFGASLGFGYDFPVGFVAVLNPVVNLNYGNYGTVRTPAGEEITGTSTLVLQLAVGLTFQ